MIEKSDKYIVRVALEATLSFSTNEPISAKDLVLKVATANYGANDHVEQIGEKMLYIISTEPVGETYEDGTT